MRASWRGDESRKRKFPNYPLPSKKTWIGVSGSIQAVLSGTTNFQFQNTTCDREFWLRSRLSILSSIRGDGSVSGRNVCSNIIYLHIGETCSANANFKLFRAIWPTCPNKEKNKRVPMSVDNERSLTCPIWIFPNGCKWKRDRLCVVKATSEKKKEHADKQTCLPVHGTIEFSRRAFRFFSNKRYRRVRAYIIPLSRYLGLCSPFIPTDPRNDESRRRSHCRVRCIETLITAVRGQGTVEKDRFLLSID